MRTKEKNHVKLNYYHLACTGIQRWKNYKYLTINDKNNHKNSIVEAKDPKALASRWCE